jgi:hypothetical protein
MRKDQVDLVKTVAWIRWQARERELLDRYSAEQEKKHGLGEQLANQPRPGGPELDLGRAPR